MDVFGFRLHNKNQPNHTIADNVYKGNHVNCGKNEKR
jgi:hypothetical protein